MQGFLVSSKPYQIMVKYGDTNVVVQPSSKTRMLDLDLIDDIPPGIKAFKSDGKFYQPSSTKKSIKKVSKSKEEANN